MKIADVVAAGQIINAVQEHQKVAMLTEDQKVIYGTLRHLVKDPENYGFATYDQEVEKVWVRVTTVGGWDMAWSMPDMIQWRKAGNLFFDVTIPVGA